MQDLDCHLGLVTNAVDGLATQEEHEKEQVLSSDDDVADFLGIVHHTVANDAQSDCNLATDQEKIGHVLVHHFHLKQLIRLPAHVAATRHEDAYEAQASSDRSEDERDDASVLVGSHFR